MKVSSHERKSSLAVLAVVAGVLVSVGCGGGYGSSPSSMPSPSPAPATGGVADVTITINSMSGAQSFTANPGVVRVGQKVSWHNADNTVHTATGSGFDTGTIPPGGTSAPITFGTAGTIAYHCTIHPSMVGSLDVTQ